MRGVIKIEFYTIPVLQEKHKVKLHDTYKEREKEVLRLLEKYSDYFLIGQMSTNKDELQRFYNNWVGVKSVGKKYPDQTMKMNLNSMSNYLAYSRDYVIKTELDELVRFEHMKKNDKKYEETDKHKALKSKCLFVNVHKYKNKQDYVFMVNEQYENEVLKHDEERYHLVQAIKNQASSIYQEIRDLTSNKKLLKEKIKAEYEIMKLEKDKSSVSTIIGLTKQLKEDESNIVYLKKQLLDLIDDYHIETRQFF